MGIRGVGIDIVRVPRIKDLVDKWGNKFLERIYTESELDYCLTNRRRHEHLAGRFAAKEAIVKAVGKKLPWKSIEVLSESNGRPVALVYDDKEEGFLKENLHISITHIEDYALAMVILEG